MVIDDDLEFVEVMREILEDDGYTVRTVSSLTFTSFFSENPPDAFIIDVWFSDTQNSLDFIKALRRDDTLRTVPILLVSSDTSMARLKDQGMVTSFHEKPLRVQSLLEELQTI